jgi:hypothetical protein
MTLSHSPIGILTRKSLKLCLSLWACHTDLPVGDPFPFHGSMLVEGSWQLYNPNTGQREATISRVPSWSDNLCNWVHRSLLNCIQIIIYGKTKKRLTNCGQSECLLVFLILCHCLQTTLVKRLMINSSNQIVSEFPNLLFKFVLFNSVNFLFSVGKQLILMLTRE